MSINWTIPIWRGRFWSSSRRNSSSRGSSSGVSSFRRGRVCLRATARCGAAAQVDAAGLPSSSAGGVRRCDGGARPRHGRVVRRRQHDREINAEMAKLTLGDRGQVALWRRLHARGRRSRPADGRCARRRQSASEFRVLQLPSWVPTRRNLRERRALAKLDGMLHALIQPRRTSGERRDDLLSVLLAAVDEDSGARMSDRQLRDEMMTLFLAGHETTANALTWTWYLLSQHPEVEARLLGSSTGFWRPCSRRRPTSESAVHRHGRSRGHSPVSAGIQGSHESRSKTSSSVDTRSRREASSLSTPTRFNAIRGSSTTRTIRPRALRAWLGRAHPALRVSAVWRRPARLHRQRLRDDGGAADPRDDRATLPAVVGAWSAGRCRFNL